MYSIASSQKAVGAEAHLTVALEHRLADSGAARHGAASHWIARRGEGETLSVYVQANERFRVPTDASRDLIMIGPGTGVAPFRGFVQERVATGATGRHWLFFGNRRFGDDFLYQLEWQQALKAGTLHELDLAFSRDQDDKHYVQHRIAARGRELYDWLQSGAHLYVCGDAERMAKDVHAALIAVLERHGGLEREDAAAQLHRWQDEGRYARDVY